MARTASLILLAAVCMLVALSAAPARGADGGLYPDAAPPGSAFLRFLNGSDKRSAEVQVNGKEYGKITVGKITRYASLPQGEAAISIGPAEASIQLKEGRRYCAVFANGAIKVLEEPEGNNPLKAQIVLINVSSADDISLKTADGSVGIVDAVDPMQLGGRAVNAAHVPLSVYDKQGQKIQDFEARSLKRGERYAVVIYDGPGGKPAAAFY